MEYISAPETEKPIDKRYKACASEITIEKIFQQYSDYIFHFAYKLSGKVEKAEDISLFSLL